MSNPATVEADTILGKLRASRPAQGLAGRLRLPGDTALGLRAMALAALSVGPSDITGLPDGTAARALATALRQLGARVEHRREEALWQVWGRGIGGLDEPSGPLDAGASPLVAHMLAGMAAGHPLLAVLAAEDKPLPGLAEGLSATGAHVACRRGARPPFSVQGTSEPLPPDLDLPADPEGLLTTALVLAALCARGRSRLGGAVTGGIDRLLGHFGASATMAEGALLLDGQPELQATALRLPAEPLAAAAAAVAALLVPGSALAIEDLPPDSPLLPALRALGAEVEAGAGHVSLRHGALRGADLPEDLILPLRGEGPLLAVAAAFAKGTTRLRGAAGWGEARLAALAGWLTTNGAKTLRDGNDLILTGDGRPLTGGGHLPSQEEACIAMSAIVLGLAADTATTMEDTSLIEATSPGFLQVLATAAGTGALVRA